MPIAAALAALVAYSFAERWAILDGSPFPVGVDGYFYPIQLRALLETGHLEYPASPLAFWLMAPFAAATDPVTGAKLGAAFYGALIALPAYGLGVRLSGGRGAGLVAAVLATRSAGSAYLSVEFVKNGIGLTIALAALWLLLRALESPSRGRLAAAAAGIAAAAATHKMAAGLIAVIAVPAVLAEAAGRGRRARILLAALAAVVAAALGLGLAFPRQLMSPADAALFDGLLTADARWDAPAHAGPRGELLLGHEALIGLIVGFLAALALTRLGRASADPAAAPPPAVAAARWAVVGLAIALGLPWLDVTDPQGLAFRLRVAAFVPLALAAAIFAGPALGRLRAGDTALYALAALLALRTPGTRTEGLITTHPALITSVHALTGQIPPGDTAIMPERHIAYMIAWYLRAPISLRPDPIPVERRWRVLPLAWIGAGSALDRALLAARTAPGPRPLGLHPRHPNGMVLVPESVWQSIAAQLPADSSWAAWPTR